MVEGFAELQEVKSTSKSGLRILLNLCDLDLAIRHLTLKEHRVVLLHGMLGIRDADKYLGVDRVTVWRWYMQAIARLTDILNSG